MRVYLTFDVEIWCNGWSQLDAAFPASYERYVYGRSAQGDYALPKTLEILNRHGLKGVFFIEPLFSARFGEEYLARLVTMVREAGQEVQLHLHPEWVDEIQPPILPDIPGKRQHLAYYSLEEQTSLIGQARQLLETAGADPVTAFRAGSYRANRDTYTALHRNNLLIDSSLNELHSCDVPDLAGQRPFRQPFPVDGVTVLPIGLFRDGFGKLRPAQVGACGEGELQAALLDAASLGWRDFVIVSHNFEMLVPGKSVPDPVVVKRFEGLCRFLAEQREGLVTAGFNELAGELQAVVAPPPDDERLPKAGRWQTARRYGEQAVRRLW